MSTGFSAKVPDCVVKTCYELDGVIMPTFMPLEVMKRVRKFTCRPDDLFVVTYPKSGTTWAELLVLLVKHDGDGTKLDGKHFTSMIPFIEITDFETGGFDIDEAEAMSSPRIFKSHCHSPFLPVDISTDDPKAKVLYIARNPKDTAVSYYHFCNMMPGMPPYESWDVFFEEFLANRAPQGSWFGNVLPFWKRRDHPNVLFLTYENMKKDLNGAVRQISEFMGKSLSDDVIEKIATASTFKTVYEERELSKMRASPTKAYQSLKNPSLNPDKLFTEEMKKSGKSLMRKGAIGDWKNYFNDDQNRRFDELYKKEIAGSGLEMQFE